MITLVIEAATYAGSAALLRGDRLIGERSVAMRGRDREALMPAVGELLMEQGIEPRALTRVVCGAGPGSFTSLRIAGGIAKGLAMAAGVPLVPVSSLALLVASQVEWRHGRYLAAIDALRGEHYTEIYEVAGDGTLLLKTPRALLPSPELAHRAEEEGATLVCAGAGPDSVVPHARGAARLSSLIDTTTAADLAGWEPAYGRLAEAQVRWEAAHGRPLATT